MQLFYSRNNIVLVCFSFCEILLNISTDKQVVDVKMTLYLWMLGTLTPEKRQFSGLAE